MNQRTPSSTPYLPLDISMPANFQAEDPQPVPPAMPVPQVDPAFLVMQENLTKLQSFLVAHTAEMTSLRRRFQAESGPSGGVVPAPILVPPRNVAASPVEPQELGLGRSVPHSLSISSSHIPLLASTSETSSDSANGNRISPNFPTPSTGVTSLPAEPPLTVQPHLDAHTRELQRFLNVHIRNVHLLLGSIATTGSPPRTPYSAQSRVPRGNIRDDRPVQPPAAEPVHTSEDASEKMKTLSHQFSILVVFSTFTAGLIIAYLQLMSAVLPAPDWDANRKEAVHWYMGFNFGFTGLVLNIGIAIVAGADTAACTSGKPWKPLHSVRDRFMVLVFIQFLGAAVFGGCIGMLLYPFHNGSILVLFPMVILTITILVAASDLANTSGEVRKMKSEMKDRLRHIFNFKQNRR